MRASIPRQERSDEKLTVLQVHNFYQQPGGEDVVFEAEHNLLVRHGHAVKQLSLHNDSISSLHPLKAASKTIWNRDSYRLVSQALADSKAGILHAHNTFPLFSPSIYYAAHSVGVPVVQTLHNYRLICPSATLYRDGHVCGDCVHKPIPLPGVLHKCYKASYAASATVAAMLTAHRALRTFRRRVNCYIALSSFARSRFIEGGLPAELIAVKPNFLEHDPGEGPGDGDYAVFIGRLTEEKGVRTLLRAWRLLPGIRLEIVGDGPLAPEVCAFAAEHRDRLRYRPSCDRAAIFELLKRANCLIVPSEWYEEFPLTFIEAAACGTPSILAQVGPMRAFSGDDPVPFTFVGGSAESLASEVRRLYAAPDMQMVRRLFRQIFEKHYTADRNYTLLRNIYERARTKQ